eukprot:3170658-Amphidinium_carterae.1
MEIDRGWHDVQLNPASVHPADKFVPMLQVLGLQRAPLAILACTSPSTRLQYRPDRYGAPQKSSWIAWKSSPSLTLTTSLRWIRLSESFHDILGEPISSISKLDVFASSRDPPQSAAHLVHA